VIQFLTSTSTVRLIERIVIEAEDDLVLVSPSPRISKSLMDQMASAGKRGVSITLMVDDILADEGDIERIVENSGAHIVRCTDLNGHCYANEQMMVVTSMALSDTPPSGIHLGTSFTSDERVYQDAVNELLLLSGSADGSESELSAGPSDDQSSREGLKEISQTSPLMRVIRGGLRNRLTRRGPDVDRRPACSVCDGILADPSAGSLCPDCAGRKHYQHTALYRASDFVH
jgi:hypothetical protein